MVEERVTQVETPSGETHTHTTVVSDRPTSGGATWLIVVLVVILAAVAVFYLSGMSSSEVAKDNAIADAADEVGTAASQAGEAVQDAADAVTN